MLHLSMPWPWFRAGVGQVGVRSVKEGLPAGEKALKQQCAVLSALTGEAC